MTDWLTLKDLESPVRRLNLDVLKKRYPNWADYLSGRFDSGNVRARIQTNSLDAQALIDGEWTTITSGERTLADVRAVATEMVKCWQIPADLIVTLGSGACLWLDPIQPFLEPDRVLNRALIIIEPIEEVLLLTLSVTDLAPALTSQRVFWCVGQDWQSQLRDVLVGDRLGGARQVRICPACPSAGLNYTELLKSIPDTFQTLRLEYHTRTNELVAQLAESTSSRNYTDPPQTAYMICNQNSYATHFVMDGLSEGMRANRINVAFRSVEPGRFYAPETPVFDLDEHHPELIITPNYPFSFYAGAWARDLHIPQVLWFTDAPVHEIANPKLGEWDAVACFDPGYIDELEQRLNRPVHELPGAATLLDDVEPQSELACDICLVGSIRSETEIFESLSQDECQWLEERVEQLLGDRGLDLIAAMQEFPPPPTLSEKRNEYHLATNITAIANSRYRFLCAKSLEKFRIHLYGSEAWLKKLPEDSSLRDCYKGFVHNSEQLAAIYRSSKIVLACHGLLSRSGLTMACWNGFAQQSCVLADNLPAMERYFSPGDEIAVFNSPADLPDVADALLADDALRKRISKAGRDRVLREHTFKKRAQSLLEDLPRLLSARTQNS